MKIKVKSVDHVKPHDRWAYLFGPTAMEYLDVAYALFKENLPNVDRFCVLQVRPLTGKPNTERYFKRGDDGRYHEVSEGEYLL